MREDIYCRAAEAQITRLALGFGALLAEDGSVPARITAAIAQAAEASLDNLRAALAVQASTLAATVGSDRDSITGPSPHIHSPRTVMLI